MNVMNPATVSPEVAANLLTRNWFGDQVAQRFWDELWGEESSASTSA